MIFLLPWGFTQFHFPGSLGLNVRARRVLCPTQGREGTLSPLRHQRLRLAPSASEEETGW